MSEEPVQPKFIDLLSEADVRQYNSLRSMLSSNLCRNCRNKRLENFSEMLSAVKSFCIRGNDDDWKRCLVCGVCWLPVGIGVNIRQLSILISKCKSSINGSLQKMGFGTFHSKSDANKMLSDIIPLLKDNFLELREWTVRQYMANTPQPTKPLPQPIPQNMYSPQPNYAELYTVPQQTPQWNQIQPELAESENVSPSFPIEVPVAPSFKSSMFEGTYLPGPDESLKDPQSQLSSFEYQDDPDPYALEPSYFYDD